MAIPPAIRVLGFVTMAVFCWLVVQIFRVPSGISLPGQAKESVKFDDMIRDPNLDRKLLGASIQVRLTDCAQLLASLQSLFIEYQGTTMRQIT